MVSIIEIFLMILAPKKVLYTSSNLETIHPISSIYRCGSEKNPFCTFRLVAEQKGKVSKVKFDSLILILEHIP